MCLLPVAVQAAARRPGIVLIMADDLARGMTGFEGHPQIKTPNLDRLAAESVHFTRCYTPTPQGAPSRASVLTGLYPHAHGVTSNGSKEAPVALPAQADTFSARLRASGYSLGIVGKWQLPDGATTVGFGFDRYPVIHGSAQPWKQFTAYVRGNPRKVKTHLTEWQTQLGIDFLKMNYNKPFFLWLCYQTPHEPLEYPPGTEELYPPASITLPDTKGFNARGGFSTKVRSAAPVQAFKSHNEKKLREARSKYYAMVTHLDQQVGVLLDQLDTLRVREKVIVLFVSDNGWALGEHQLFSKGPFFYDELIRVPLLVRWPGRAQPGTQIDRVVSLVDLAPTLLAMADLTPPRTMQGRSLVPLIDHPKARRHGDECFLEYHEQNGKNYTARGIVTRQYKFIDYLRTTSDVLFDLSRDPKELKNVEKMPEYAAILDTLRNRIKAWRRTSRDPLTEESKAK